MPPGVWLFVAATGTYALDRSTKLWAESMLSGRPPIVVIPGVLNLSYTTNSGGAFGLGQSAWWVFAFASIAISLAIVVTAFRVRTMPTALALGLILGGALGNLTDRLVRADAPLHGRVVDFIDVHVWPVFNLADTAIVVGALILAVFAVRHEGS
jgi:signal peptidase II